MVIAILAWAISAGVAYIFALRTIDASFVDGRFFPVYGDSFYHARRILDVFQGSMEYFSDPWIHMVGRRAPVFFKYSGITTTV